MEIVIMLGTHSKFILGLVAGVSLFASPASAQLADLFKERLPNVIGPAGKCGYLAAVLGQSLGDEDTGRYAAIGGAAVCAVVAFEMDRRRSRVIQEEEALDRQIVDQTIANEALSQKNDQLRNKLEQLEEKAERLRLERVENPRQILDLQVEIQAEKDAAIRGIEILDRRIQTIDARLAREPLTDNDRTLLEGARENLVQRRALYVAISQVAFSREPVESTVR